MLFAAEKAAGSCERFAAREIDSAMRAGDHRLNRGLRRAFAALPGNTGQQEVHDDCRDDEKEELAHAAMAACVAVCDEAPLYRRRTRGRYAEREIGRGDWKQLDTGQK